MVLMSKTPPLVETDWNAQWVWSAPVVSQPAPLTQQTVYFRRTFHAQQGSSLTINISADTRYRLYVNGQSASFGPCKGHHFAQYFDTVDVTDYLREGINVIAVKVWHLPNLQPFAIGAAGAFSMERATSGGLLVEGALCDEEGRPIEQIDTNGTWKCLVDTAVTPGTPWPNFWVATQERVDGTLLPHGWTQVDFDDASWIGVTPLEWAHKTPDGVFHHGELTPWYLRPRPIPHLYEKAACFTRVMQSSGPLAQMETMLIPSANKAPITISANTSSFVEVDAGLLTTGFLTLSMSGGKGAKVTITTSECYENTEDGRATKGRRDDCSLGELKGAVDVYLPSGRQEEYEPFWFRTFRFVRLLVETSDEPLMVSGFGYRETGYPLEVKAAFQCSDEDYNKLWDISINTLRRCMHETYEDCPFFEQLQYAMDTRLQILYTYAVSNDPRLARKAIDDFHSSLTPDGLVQSRFPSAIRQLIPSFALHWVGMLEEYVDRYNDIEFAKRYRGTVDAVIGWFERHIGPSGLYEGNVHWSFVDWVVEWKNNSGVPNSLSHGPDAITTLIFSATLQQAAKLMARFGRNDVASEYGKLAHRLNAAVMESCWDSNKGMLTDGPNFFEYSQHAQAWAILAGAFTDKEVARRALKATFDSEGIAQCSYSMSFFLFRALEAVGLYDLVHVYWETYRGFLAMNLTTLPEDPYNMRSDCHGWSATPLFEFTTSLLGVRANEPGFSSILVKPEPGPLSWAKGTACTSRGEVEVSWKCHEDGTYSISGQGPEGIPLTVMFPDGREMYLPDGGVFES